MALTFMVENFENLCKFSNVWGKFRISLGNFSKIKSLLEILIKMKICKIFEIF